jgi:hypothetical protein
MSPANQEKPVSSSVLVFDTTVTPVEYHGVIYINGPDDVVAQTCSENSQSVNYGGKTVFLIVEPREHLTVKDQKQIVDFVEYSTGLFYDFTITRTK